MRRLGSAMSAAWSPGNVGALACLICGLASARVASAEIQSSLAIRYAGGGHVHNDL